MCDKHGADKDGDDGGWEEEDLLSVLFKSKWMGHFKIQLLYSSFLWHQPSKEGRDTPIHFRWSAGHAKTGRFGQNPYNVYGDLYISRTGSYKSKIISSSKKAIPMIFIETACLINRTYYTWWLSDFFNTVWGFST